MARGRAKGDMSVREAGRKGGRRTSQTHDHEFYSKIGHLGGQRVSRLINKGKQLDS